MATIVMGMATGGAFAAANPFIAAVMMAAAAAVDSFVIMPMFIDEPTSTPEFGSWDVNYAEEGSPGRYLYGEHNRVPGHIILAGHPWHTTTYTGSSKRGKVEQNHWWADVVQAYSFNEVFHVDRIDMESNTQYRRDPTHFVYLNWIRNPLVAPGSTGKFRVNSGPYRSNVVWERTGSVGSHDEWSLKEWHITIENLIDPSKLGVPGPVAAEMPELAGFQPGEFVSVESNAGHQGFGNAKTPNANQSLSYQLTGPTYNPTTAGTIGGSFSRQNPWGIYNNTADNQRGFLVISSRHFGHVEVAGVKMQRSRLVLDVLGVKDKWGMLRNREVGAREFGTRKFGTPPVPTRITNPVTSQNYARRSGYFGQGMYTEEKDRMDLAMSDIDNPFSYVQWSTTQGWPRWRSVGGSTSADSINIRYQVERRWSIDALASSRTTSQPIFGEDYLEHSGSPTSYADPIYSGHVGVVDAPTLPGIGYMSFSQLNLSRFGNRIPQMHFYIDAREYDVRGARRPTLTARRMLEIMLSHHAGLPDYRYGGNATNVNTGAKLGPWNTTISEEIDIHGYNFGGLQEPVQQASNILMRADYHCIEKGGQVGFITRDNRSTVYLGWKHLDAREWNSPSGNMLKIQDHNQRTMPRRVNLKFMDVDRDMQFGEVYASRDSTVGRWSQTRRNDSDLVVTRQVSIKNMSLSDEDARGVAERVLADSTELRQTVELRLPFWYVNITETDVIKLGGYNITPGLRGINNPISYATKYMNRDFYIVVEEVDIGADFYVEVKGYVMSDDPVTFTTATATAPTGGSFGASGRERFSEVSGKLNYSAPSMTVVMELPSLLDAHVGTAGFYIAHTAPGATFRSEGRMLFESIGDADDWLAVGDAGPGSIIGTVIDKLDSGLVGVIGAKPNLVVKLLTDSRGAGALETVSTADLLNGANLAAVGQGRDWEIIQFQTATEDYDAEFSSDSRWALSNLRRGLMGTEDYVDTHSSGELFVLLNRNGLHFHAVDNSFIGLTRRYQVSAGSADDVRGGRVNVEGRSSLSLPVANLVAWRKTNGDVVLTWNRRTRARYRTFGTQAAPLVEGTESYDIVVDLGTDRTINVASETGIYTAAMQSTDSTSGLEVTVTVYQRDNVRGQGEPKIIIVAQTQAEVGNNDGNVIGTENGHTLNTPLGGGMD